MGLGIAIRAFSAGLFNRQLAEQIGKVLDGQTPTTTEPKLPAPVEADIKAQPVAPQPPTRSDAITLLSALQREARLVDLIQEDLTQFSDAQVGAAARPCLQQCNATLGRLIGLNPVSDAKEGSTVDAGTDASPARFQWIGEGTGTSGKLIHQGWQATKVDLPQWTGNKDDANIVAPAQLQR
ncbi:hypothetical protein LF1_25670 [Rubripirellula obstinata]|uniref:DUF2760 domain-containing protein n=1 Tax=Rubripirellula obstinata TaxID=406547 RepID=A0A5B1CJX5_9BACT|nr:DUF2760 domain-containing protein [Rubripirellula obstinata]KAA1260029.1 hypothetical protein LF1_25670 [Rubripirellula obstinata]